MRLLLDENLSPQHAEYLRQCGHDALAVLEAGLSGEKDETVREFAIAQGRVLVTLDADFSNMLRFPTAGTPGVIRLKVHPPSEAKIRVQIEKALSLLQGRDLAGCLAVLQGNVMRIRG